LINAAAPPPMANNMDAEDAHVASTATAALKAGKPAPPPVK